MSTRNRLTKSSRNSMIFGVAGGLAEYFDVDPTLMRIIFVVTVVISAGTAIIAYILMAIIMPGDDEDFDDSLDEDNERSTRPRDARRRRNLLGIILIGAGALALIAQFGILSWWSWGIFWPVLLIILGVAFIISRIRRA